MKKSLFALVASLAIFFLEAETLCFSYLSLKNKSFVSAESLFHQNFKFDHIDSNSCTWRESIGLHPYLSIYYPNRENCESFHNNYGIRGADMPLHLNPNLYTVLITGSSVAEQLGGLNIDGSKNMLEEELNAHWIAPNHKAFKVINASTAAAIQPITLIQNILFANRADEVISIEGFNEHFGLPGRRQLEQPPQVWFDLSSEAEYPFHYWALKKLGNVARYTGQSFLIHSYSAFFILTESINHLRSFLNQKEQLLSPFPLMSTGWSKQQRTDYYIDRYIQYVRMEAQIVKSQNKHFTFFLQPAPSAYKELTAEEKLAMGNIDDQKSYELIKNAVHKIPPHDVRVVSLEKAFLNESETLYIDHIHTNDAGVRILSRLISEKLGALNEWKKR